MINSTTMDARYIETEKGPIFPNSNRNFSDESEVWGLDKDWVKTAFMIGDEALAYEDNADGQFIIANRYWSSADNKFTDSKIGGNIGINARPQFTRYADIRSKGKLSEVRQDVSPGAVSGNHGMGRYYSEAIDDPGQVVYLRFGVPQYSGLTSFFTNAFDGGAAKMVKTGRYPIFYKAGKVAGSLGLLFAFPAFVIGMYGLKTLNRYFGNPSYKYYTLKPTMHQYWTAVNTLVNTLSINAGLVPKIFAKDTNEGQTIGRTFNLDKDYLTALSTLMPDAFPNYDPTNSADAVPGLIFDVYAIANKAQRMANYMFIQEFDRLDESTKTNKTGYTISNMTGQGEVNGNKLNGEGTKPSLASRINEYLLSNDLYTTKANDSDNIEFNPKSPDDTGNLKKFANSYWQYFDSEIRDGAQFAAFRVDHTGQVGESFSNATMESAMSQKLNEMSGAARSTEFSFMGGQMGGALGDLIGGALGAAADVAQGLASGITMGFSDQIISMLSGAGYVDIPKTWQNSNATLPRSNYTISLVSPYGNVFSLIQNIYIPLSMLLAGALPRSTGFSSYGSPFLCQIFDKGRLQIKLGMIENLSITRGTTNLAFNLKGAPLGIDVTFSVVDLSSIMHMPISTGGLLDNEPTINEDNILHDYLAVLAGQDLNQQIYAIPKAMARAAKDYVDAGKLTSPGYWASGTNDFLQRIPLIHTAYSGLASDSNLLARNLATQQ